MQTTIEIDMNDAVFTENHVKELVQKMFGVKNSIWGYHVGKMPGPDRVLSGWPFYSSQQVDLVKAYWLRQSSVKKYLRNKATELAAEMATA